MYENQALKEGEKYLYVKILGDIKLRAYKNKDKKDSNQPDFKGEGIAIWINKKKPAVEKKENIEFNDEIFEDL